MQAPQNIDPRWKEWRFLHKQLHTAVKTGNHALKNHVTKRIKELKPFFNEFTTPKTTTEVRQNSTTVATQVQHQSTPVEPRENDESNHMAFSFYTLSGSQRAAVLCDKVFERWMKSRSMKRSLPIGRQREYYRIIETIISNLLDAEVTGLSGVRFSRRREDYSCFNRYRPDIFNVRFLTVIDALTALKIITQVKGDRYHKQAGAYFPDVKPSKVYGLQQSFMTLGPSLKMPFKPSMHDVNFITEGREIIILKKGEGSTLLNYRDEDFPEVVRYRRQMQMVNEMLDSVTNLLTPEAQEVLDQRKRHLVRRFTHSSLESGGRLWGGFWFAMKKTDRPTMLCIKGERTVELDFSNMIAQLAYIIAEKEAPVGDQYIIPGLDPESRQGIKVVMSTLFFDNNMKRDRFPRDTAKLFTQKDQAKGWAYVKRMLLAHHPALKPYMDHGLGHFIQLLESQVVVNLLVRCAQRGIVALPIHDCVIVQQSQAFRVKGLMGITVRHLFGKEASIPVEEKTFEEVKKRVA